MPSWLPWLLLAATFAFILLELATTDLAMMQCALGTTAGLIVAGTTGSLLWTVIATVAVTCLGFLFIRPRLLARLHAGGEALDAGVDTLPGKSARADTDITDTEGIVTVDGQQWSARSTAPIVAGSVVVVVSRSNAILHVRPE